ncbi:sodium-coupled monocarboxylate transporter 1-like [Asterias rubens]|uniref:sodium-coupled monocarboxylate transporter 1-like n=1 Tax=Asterias rubens TaxID=7604 RepID=UPI0014552647|nr:sodium-coupled monocarboxylate transporter 1-like [Asterias rubens]
MDDIERVGNFGVWDYVVFGGMLAISLAIGLYYGFTGGKQKTNKEFLLADRNMNPIPVAMSLVASFISAVTVLGTPAEVYINGTMFWLFALVYPVMFIVVSRLFLPVFFRLKVTSANEYLERRFNKVVRVAGTMTLFLNMVMYLGVVIYAPALALNAVTNISLWGSVLATGLVCTAYTTVGGMKAVLWTDVFQTCVMMAGFLAIIIEGSSRLGGLGNVWKIAESGERIDFWNFNIDPTIRHTFWSILIGGSFTWITTYGANQAQIQRCMTTKTLTRANIALFLAAVGMMVVVSCACLCGVVMFAFYEDKKCDPFSSKKIARRDQLIPYFMLELFGSFPGLPGLFTSAIFAAALSTVSSGLSALSAVTAEDLVKPCFPRMSQERFTLVTKGIGLGFGFLCIFAAYITSLLKQGILQLVISLFGIAGGPLLGLFSLGMFFPCSNSKGALVGLISGLAFAFWVGLGAIFIYPPVSNSLHLNISGCNLTTTSQVTLMISNMTEMPAIIQERPAIAGLYSLSYTWYTFVYCFVTVIVGLIVSLITGRGKRANRDTNLTQHCADGLCCFLPEACKKPVRCCDDKLVHYEEDGRDSIVGGDREDRYIDNGDVAMAEYGGKRE